MIGNDIVDLDLAQKESNWQRKGFLNKLFTEKEQQVILTSENPAITVWNLWSRKEAAYKIYNRATGIRAYKPLSFECIYDNTIHGGVMYNGTAYYTRTTITSESIHTVAVTDPNDFHRIRLLNSREGITKENGIPFIRKQPVSLSAHGRFREIVTLQYYSPSLDFNFKNSNAIV